MQDQADTSTQHRIDLGDVEQPQHVPIPSDIPPRVLEKVRRALAALREEERALAGVQRARGNGYILSLEVRDRLPQITIALGTLQWFRDAASAKGIDAEAVILRLGGQPDFARFGKPALNDDNGQQADQRNR